jgi:hypothetical protein
MSTFMLISPVPVLLVLRFVLRFWCRIFVPFSSISLRLDPYMFRGIEAADLFRYLFLKNLGLIGRCKPRIYVTDNDTLITEVFKPQL